MPVNLDLLYVISPIAVKLRILGDRFRLNDGFLIHLKTRLLAALGTPRSFPLSRLRRFPLAIAGWRSAWVSLSAF